MSFHIYFGRLLLFSHFRKFFLFAQEKVFPFPEPLNEEQMATLNMLVEPVEKFFEDKGNEWHNS